MKTIYKRTAWLLDDGVFLKGYTAKHRFVPDDKGCGFSYQKFRKKDIGTILFYRKEEVFKKELEFFEKKLSLIIKNLKAKSI